MDIIGSIINNSPEEVIFQYVRIRCTMALIKQVLATKAQVNPNIRIMLSIARQLYFTKDAKDLALLNTHILDATTPSFLNKLTKRLRGMDNPMDIIEDTHRLRDIWVQSLPTGLLSYSEACEYEASVANDEKSSENWMGQADYCRHIHAMLSQYVNLAASLTKQEALTVQKYTAFCLIRSSIMPTKIDMQEAIRPWIAENWPQPHA